VVTTQEDSRGALVAVDACGRLLDALDDQSEQIADSVSRRVREAIPAYAEVLAEVHRAGSAVSVSLALSAARWGGSRIDPAQVRRLVAVTRQRSAVGVPLEEMVRAWHISCRRIVECGRATGAQMGISEDVILDLADAMFVVGDHAQRLVHEARRADALAAAATDDTQRARVAFALAAVHGSLSVSELLEQAASFGLDVRRRHLVLRARPVGKLSFLQLRRALRLSGSRSGEEGVIVEHDADLIAILPGRPHGESASLVAGVGDLVSLVDLPESFRLANRALQVAVDFGLSGVHDMRSLGLRPAVAEDHDVGRALVARYVEPALGEPSGADLLDSLRGWFAAGMHVGRAADRLFVHPNTLRYRISRFETLTGANLRDHHTAFEVWWSLEHHRVTRRAALGGP
jgi:PucR C-terminal helix-turn-helix domain/GGDEF-like domain